MSLPYGIQSVIFYVLSCSTCSKISHRRKAKAVAKRERAEKQQLETEQPGLYHHPSPFNTNPFWDEEISLGPGAPSRKGGSKNASSRHLHTSGRANSLATSDVALSSQAPSSPTMVAEDQSLSGDDWNRKRYQREDEELWGVDTIKAGQRIVRDAFATAQSSVGSKLRAMEERLGKFGTVKEEANHPYYVSRNPPVNDLHPPVVSSHPFEKGGTRWMLQPPPSANIMSGKQHPAASTITTPRSRSGSRSSTIPPGTPNLSRQVTDRALEEKLRRGDTPSDVELRALSRKISSTKTQTSSAPQDLSLKIGRTRSQSASEVLNENENENEDGSGNGNGNERGDKREESSTDWQMYIKSSPLFSAVAGRRMSHDSIEDVPLAITSIPVRALSRPTSKRGKSGKKAEREKETGPLIRTALGNLGQGQGAAEIKIPSPSLKVKGRESRGDLRMTEEVEVV